MDIGKLVDGFLGSTPGTAQSTAGQALSGITNNIPGGLAGGAAAGGVVALLLGSKKARKIGGKALTYGGMAAVGALAYSAYRNYQSNQTAVPAASTSGSLAPPPADAGFDPAQQVAQDGSDMRLALLQAMISAAKADGHIDTAENARVFEQMGQVDLGAEEKAFLFDAMQRPSDPITIANLASTEAQGAELYLASALAIDPDTPEEQTYMQRLGDALRLPDALRAQLNAHALAEQSTGATG